MVEQLEEIKGYLNLSGIDKAKYAIALKAYLDDIKPDDLEKMDILEVKKHHFKKNTYISVFTDDIAESKIIIKFKKGMLLKV